MKISEEIEQMAKYEIRGTIQHGIKIRLAERAKGLEVRIKELEEGIATHEKEEYLRVPMNFDMNDQKLWRIGKGGEL